MTRTRSRYLIGGLAAGLALLLPGCGGTSAPDPDGPFGASTPDAGGQCFPTPKGDVGTFADLSFGNSGGPARIAKVTLSKARHLQLVGAWVVPATGTDLWGVFDGYPPRGIPGPDGNRGVPGVHWGQRQRADGAVIPHLRGHDQENLVLVLKPIGLDGTAATEYVWYTSGGSRYVLNLGVRVELFNGNVHGCATHGY
jgi:hypothetical protein